MINRVFDGERFLNVEAQELEVIEWQRKYESLTEALGRLGTEVIRKRVLETDAQIPPYFFTSAVHEYVFPPQPRSLVADMSRPTEGTAKNNLTIEDKIYNVDDGLVKGRVRVSYSDRDSGISFKIEEMMEYSDIPSDAQFAIDQLEDVTAPFYRD